MPTYTKFIRQYSTGLFFLLTLLFSGSTFAQTIGTSKLKCDISNRNPCTSKDLDIVSVSIDAPPCASCTPGQTATYPLKMTIHNGTKSERTSFALYGTLSSGASINGQSGEVFICVGAITVKSDQTLPGESAPGNQTFAVGTISFTCGQDLTLSNNFLAWTDAAGATLDRCNTFAQATKCSDIAPKCGTAQSITITGPVVPPTLAKVDPTCTVSTGCVSVTSSTTGFTFSLDGGAFTAYPTGGWCNLSSAQHCVRSKRTLDNCISPASCVTIPGAPASPARPVVTLEEATICGSVTTPSLTVSCVVAGTYTLTQPGESNKTVIASGASTPVSFSLKPGIGFSITVSSAGCVSDPTTCTNYTSNSCPTANASTLETPVVSSLAQTLVKVAPNPYNDRIRFSVEVAESGKSSLELYSITGQKLKTVFEGHLEKGQTKYIEYNVPFAQRAMMIYVFRQGNQKTAGKLISNR